MKDVNNIIVTTGDLKRDYEVIGPVYFQVSNKGLFSSALSKLIKKYSDQIAKMKKRTLSGHRSGESGRCSDSSRHCF